MNRIDQIFADLRARDARGLMSFVTAGDPDLATTAELLPAMAKAGACICELGVPFSDPLADGPVIQASMTHALDHGVRPGQVLEAVRAARPGLDLGVVAMLSYSIVHRIGPEAFFADAAAAGVDGLILPDLPLEEAPEAVARAREAGLVCAMLVAPSTPIDRAKRIAELSSGFVYVVARAGITGESKSLPPELPERIAALRGVTGLPMAVGFGVSSAEHVRQVAGVADAVIVGSAIVRRIAERRDRPRAELVEELGGFVRELAGGLG